MTEANKANESDLILNEKTNRFVKRSSQTGKRLMKQMASSPPIVPIVNIPPIVNTPTPVQTALLETCVELVTKNTPEFKNLTADETDAPFKKLLLERLSIAPAKAKPKPKKKGHFRVVSSESESSD